MKIKHITFFIFLTVQLAFAQSQDTWISFWDDNNDLMGFKNAKGQTTIEPKFMGLTIAKKFDHIMVAMEEKNGSYDAYYLTKSGEKVGRDSLYTFDNGVDCESEGFIRFRDNETNNIGMFNKNGKIAIPATYNALSKVHNGLVTALVGAEKKYWDNHNESGCNHYSWDGGQVLLIDTANNVLIENFEFDKALNLFTIEKTKETHPNPIRKSFVAKNGGFYSFIEFKEEFKQWINTELQSNLTQEKLIAISYDTLYWTTKNGWDKTNKTELIANNFSVIKNGLLEILQPTTDYFISDDGLNPFIYKGAEFDNYFNNCGESKEWIYPTMTIIINHKDLDGKFSQNHYEFLRIEYGYKLISLSIRNETIKLPQKSTQK